MYHIVYRTRDPITGEYYIGKHSTTDLDDGYQGSGRWVEKCKADGRSLTTVTLAVFQTEDEALEFEREVVDDIRLSDPLCRNLTRGGRGSFAHLSGGPQTAEKRKKIGKSVREYLMKVSPEERRARRGHFKGKPRPEHAKLMRENNPFKGKKHTEETKRLIGNSRTSEERAESARGNTNVRGRKRFNDGVRNYTLPEEE